MNSPIRLCGNLIVLNRVNLLLEKLSMGEQSGIVNFTIVANYSLLPWVQMGMGGHWCGLGR